MTGLSLLSRADQRVCVALSDDRQAWEIASQRSREYMDNRFNLTRMTAPYIEALSNLYERAAPVRAN